MNIADDLKNAYEDGYEKGFNDGFEVGQRDVQPERKKGKWIKSPSKYPYYDYMCSVCRVADYRHIVGRNGQVKMMNYCPICGADMRGEE